MDLAAVAPLVSTGRVSETVNLWLAVPIGFVFGFGLYHAGFTDSRRIASAFYLKDVGVPVVMFSAIVTGMLGLWVLGLTGFLDLSQVYFLPTYLAPMAMGGLLFGIGMALGGFCPGTAVASVATGRIDAMVFVVGFLGGSLVFGDLFPVWGDFYKSDDRGVYRLDQLFGTRIGIAVLIVVVAAVAGSLAMRYGQRLFWTTPKDEQLAPQQVMKFEAPAVVLALLVAVAVTFFPSAAFEKGPGETPYYVIQKTAGGPPAAPAALPTPAAVKASAAPPSLPAGRREGC